MTLIPLNFHQLDPKKNLARSIVALASIATKAVETPAVYGVTAGVPPVRPLLVPATKASNGFKDFYGSFSLTAKASDPTKTEFRLELPYSAKVFALTLNQRQSILTVSNLMPGIKPLSIPADITSTPSNLEQYAYDQAVAIAALAIPGQNIKFSQQVEALTGRTYLAITGTLDDAISALLSDETAPMDLVP